MASSSSGVGSSAPVDSTGGSRPQSSTARPLLANEQLRSLMEELDKQQQVSDDVRRCLLEMGDDFIESVLNQSVQLAKHRSSNKLDVQDINYIVQKKFWLPSAGSGSSSDKSSPNKRKAASGSGQSAADLAAHNQRMNVIRKQLKTT